ncbi:unnamed protein product, partial [Ectocarpus sp. 12 AP-2014]
LAREFQPGVSRRQQQRGSLACNRHFWCCCCHGRNTRLEKNTWCEFTLANRSSKLCITCSALPRSCSPLLLLLASHVDLRTCRAGTERASCVVPSDPSPCPLCVIC